MTEKTSFDHFLALLTGLLVAGLLVAFAALPAQGETFSWRRTTCPPSGSDPGFLFTCGQLGTYYEDVGGESGPGNECAVAGGSETLQLYPQPTPQAWSAELYPCGDGSCFCRHGECSAAGNQQPWVAVLDWDQWHGRTQAAMIAHQLEGSQEISLLDLPAMLQGTAGDDVGGVTDLHVLAGLCALLSSADAGDRPPAVVSMSFGRSACSADTGGQGETSLADEIALALEALKGRHDVVPVAALGNHGRALFPASEAVVVAAGSLDLAAWVAPEFDVRPSWETPAGADALLPAAGLCLPFAGPFSDGYWRSPSGSSYAGSFFAGWLADALESGALDVSELERPGPWHPSPDDEPGNYVLGRAGHDYPTTWSAAASGLLEVLADAGHACWNAGQDLEATVTARPLASNPLDGLPSREQLECEHYVRTPETDYCVPCIGGGNRTSGGGRLAVPGLFEIDLSASPVLHDDVSLRRVLLRVHDAYFELELSQQQLGELDTGTLGRLGVDGANVPEGASVSLIWELRLESAQLRYWTSSPVPVPPSPGP